MNLKKLFTLIMGLLFVASCAAKKPVDTTKKDQTQEEEVAEVTTTEPMEVEEQEEEPVATTEETETFTMNNVNFSFDSAILTEAETAKLNEYAKFLKKNPNIKVSITGHCDERGSHEYNMALGLKRSVAIKKYLINLGITEERIISESKGEEDPLALGKASDDYAKNRRGEFEEKENS